MRIAGTGSYLPDNVITNADLMKLMETSDEWIVQRTGIRERRRSDPKKGESTTYLSTEALRRACENARMDPSELDLIIVATICPEMMCPPVSCRVAAALNATPAGAFDLSAACCGFVFGLNVAHDLITSGAHRAIGLVGCDTLTNNVDYTTEGRACAIIFGDAAGAAVIRATDDPNKGIIAQSMHADGRGFKDLYIPRHEADFPPGHTPSPAKFDRIQMNGQAVFKFAVSTFSNLISQTLDRANMKPEDVAMFVCHQSNLRILEAARDRFGLPPEKLYVNIDRVGNTSAGSVPLCLDELNRAGRIREGDRVMFVAFGGGLTWGASLWQL